MSGTRRLSRWARAAAVAVAVAIGATGLAALPAQASTTTDVVNLALANVGGMACGTNSGGGHGFYGSCTGNGGQPEYWCADFVKWLWANSGVTDLNGLTAAARSFYVYGANRGILSGTPTVGAAVVFSNNRGDTSAGGGGIHHVAVVSKVNGDGTIETVSGDWGGQAGTEAHFAGTSHVIHNTPAYGGAVGSYSSVMRMYVEGYIPPPGVGAGSTRSAFSEGRGILYYPQGDGRLLWYDHAGYLGGTQDWTGNSGAQVSQGWHEYSKVFSGGNGIVYGISSNGDLHWYKNTGYLSGTTDWADNSGTVVSHGWNEFREVFSEGDGILYGITQDGRMIWYHHTGYLTGTADWTGNSGTQVSQGWDEFSHVVGGSDGVIYGVDADGRLLWYDHTGYKSGAADWTGNSATQVSGGWDEFAHIFSGGNGILYAVKQNGDLLWYDHTGYHTGTPAWTGNSSALVSHGWNN
jgi:hypothetical protein